MSTMLQPTIIRASSLPGYIDCSRRAATRLFPEEIKAAGFILRDLRRGIGAAVGTAVHKGAAVMLTEKAVTGNLPPADVASDAAIETLREETSAGVEFDGKATLDMLEAEVQVLRMTAVYRRDVAPEIQPMIVEERLEAVVLWSTQGLILSGQSDVIAREPGQLRDLKTGQRLGNYNGQLGAYSLLARSTGIDVQSACIDFVQRVHITSRTKMHSQPPAVIQRHDISKVEIAAANILRHIDADLRTFREGAPEHGILPGDPWAFPANPSSMLCSAKWCAAHSTAFCREHQ